MLIAIAKGDPVNNAYLLVGIVVGLLVITGYLRNALKSEIRSVIKEVTPNGGETRSLGDTAKRTEEKISEHIGLDLKIQKKQNRQIKDLRKQVEFVHVELRTLNGMTVERLTDQAEEHLH